MNIYVERDVPSHQGTLRVFNFRVLIPHYSTPNYRPGHLRAIQHHRHAPPSPRHTATPEHQRASHRSSVYSINPYRTRFHPVPTTGPRPSPACPQRQRHTTAIPTTQPGRSTATWELTHRRHSCIRNRQYHSNCKQPCPPMDTQSEPSYSNHSNRINHSSHSDHFRQLTDNQQQFTYSTQPQSHTTRQHNQRRGQQYHIENSRTRLLRCDTAIHDDQ